MKKTIVALTSLVCLTQSCLAARGNLYIGLTGVRNNWHVKQRMQLDPNKVRNTGVLNVDQRAKRQQFTGEIVGGVRLDNGIMYGALEAWFDPTKVKIRTARDNPNIRYVSRLSKRYGGRIKFGVEDKNLAIFGILGLGKTRTRTNSVFPNTGIYGRRPGPSLVDNSFGRQRLMRSVGIGANYTFNRTFMLNIEYLHNKIDTSSVTSETFITVLNPIGKQRSIITSDTLQVGIKYMFLPFVI